MQNLRMQYIPACAQAVTLAVPRAMKRLFILPVLLFLTIPYAQGQELYGVNRFDLQVSGLGGVKNNVPEIPATDVYPYLGFSGTVTSYVASRENRRHPGIENRHRLGVAFAAFMYDGYADKGLQLGVKYLMPKPPGSSLYFASLHGVEFRETQPGSDGEECIASDPCKVFVSSLEMGRTFPNTGKHAFNLSIGVNYRWRSDIDFDYYYSMGWVLRLW